MAQIRDVVVIDGSRSRGDLWASRLKGSRGQAAVTHGRRADAAGCSGTSTVPLPTANTNGGEKLSDTRRAGGFAAAALTVDNCYCHYGNNDRYD